MKTRFSRAAKWALTVLITAAVVGAASTAAATVMKYFDLADLVEESEVIVHGTVVGQKTLIDPVRDQVVTRTTVDVITNYHGPKAETFTFQQWGGEWEGVTHKIPGDPDFVGGEEVVLFLNEGTGKFKGYYLTAMGQSKWVVRRDADQARIYRDLTNLGLVRDEKALDIEHADLESNTFASFEAELEALVAAIKGGGQ
jgi:hypothetical protein